MAKSLLLLFGLLSLAIGSSPLSATEIGPLEGVLKPNMIKVYGDELFVVEGHKIYIYTLKDLQLKTILGRQGDGPGEYKLDPSRPLIITIDDNQIIAESRFKVVFFSRSGRYIREIKKTNFSTLQILPIGPNYLIYKYVFTNPDKNQAYFSLAIHDKDMKEIRELHRQPFFAFEDKVYVMPDNINFRIHRNSIYVEKSTEGFIIDVYDFSGQPLRTIKRAFPPLPVSSSQKEAAFADYLSIPSLARLKNEQGDAALKSYLNGLNFIYPDEHPPIMDIVVEGESIYVKTSEQMEGQDKWLILDLEGKLKKEISLPIAKKADFIVRIQGDKKYYQIHNGRYYDLRLKSLEDDEEWVLHAQNID